MPAKTDGYVIAVDTREQRPWSFDKRSTCLGTTVKKLDTGDYSLVGLENKFVIERKGSPSELATNLFDERFHRELDRLDAFEDAYVFLEFLAEDLVNYPVNSGIPKNRWRSLKVRGPLLVKTFWETVLAHPRIHWMFVGDEGPKLASSLFKRIYEKHVTSK